MKRIVLGSLIFAVCLLLIAVGRATGAPPEAWQPVDQAVGDLDALSTSLRRVPVGLRADGEGTSLFFLDQAQPNDRLDPLGRPRPHYLRVGPGFRARLDRVDYLIPIGRNEAARNVSPRRDGRFYEKVPANTVFDLTPRPTSSGSADEPAAESPASPAEPDWRVNGQIDGRVNAQVR